MAIASYYVICDQEQVVAHSIPQPKWNGAAAEARIFSLKTARLITVEAESVEEAIRGVKQLYPGWVKTVVLGVAKTSVAEE
jgi:hypothetical protein